MKLFQFLMVSLFCTAVLAADVTIVNHQDLPIYSTAVELELDELYKAAAIENGKALQAITDDGLPVILLKGSDNIARAYLSLEPGQVVGLKIKEAKNWAPPQQVCTAEFDMAAGSGAISNGVIRLDYAKGKWDLSFETSGTQRQIITDCRLDTWLDNKQRGRLLGMDPKPLGLINSSEAVIDTAHTDIAADGGVTLRLVKRFGGFAKDVVWTEIYTLLAGKPVLSYRTIFENRGSEERYLGYVELGGGVRGYWGELLKQEPLIKYEDPLSPNRVLLSGLANTYTRVAWRQQKCWLGVESGTGCGIGFSTPQSVTRELLGSTVWDIQPDGFLVCLLDEQRGNFPYQFDKDNPVDTGMLFVATSGGVDIWEQTGGLFKAVTTNKPPKIDTPYAVYFNAKPVTAAQVQGFDDKALFIPGDTDKTALDMDFSRGCLLTAKADISGKNEMVVITARLLQDGANPVVIAQLDTPEEQTIDFSAVTGWQGRKAFVLEARAAGNAKLMRLEMAAKPFTAPVLSSPADGVSLTDIAVYFRWEYVKGAIDYELQLSRDETFGKPETFNVRSEIEWPIFMPSDEQLPAVGKWFWRVRAVEKNNFGQWSSVRKMNVNDDHIKQPPKFEITPKKPLFTFEGFRITDFGKFIDLIPEDIRPYTAFNCSDKYKLIETLKPLHKKDQKVFVRTHHPGPMALWMPLSDVEEAFQAYSNVMGIMGGESLSFLYRGDESQTYTNRLLKLCGKYGLIYYEADGTYPADDKWLSLYSKEGALMLEYRDYIVFAQKNNILQRQFLSQSAVLGLYLAGDIANQGSWEDGGWYWQQVGFRKLGEIKGRRGGVVKDMPRNFWNLTFLMGISRGCAIYSLDGQTGIASVGKDYKLAERGLPASANQAAYWTSAGELTDVFHRYIAPFIRGVINHRMVPTKGQVLEQISLAVYDDGVEAAEDSDPYYRQYWPLYAGTYGFKSVDVIAGELMEFFPNTGRYYYIPFLPQGQRQLADNIKTLPLSKLSDKDEVSSVFNVAYPKWYDGDALIALVGDTLTIMNSNENIDSEQSYVLPLNGRGQFIAVSGKINTHSYVMGKFEGGNKKLWLQANAEYLERNTEIEISCDAMPQFKAVPQDGADIKWNASTGKLVCSLSHKDGAVEVEIYFAGASAELPKALILGDSISMGYTPAVKKILDGKVIVERPEANCGSTKVGLRDLDKWLSGKSPDVIHFNFGLHDLRYVFPGDKFQDEQGNYPVRGQGEPRTTLEDYKSNLKEIVRRLKQTDAKLIWCSTTPLAVDFHGYFAGLDVEYNKTAAEVMKEENVQINDLWAFAKPHLEAIQLPNNPHFTEKGSQALAVPVSQSILEALKKSK